MEQPKEFNDNVGTAIAKMAESSGVPAVEGAKVEAVALEEQEAAEAEAGAGFLQDWFNFHPSCSIQ